ncbi:20757_t:CDS:2 [Entrophospora sp. SA101]|nr:20757_t:CDS:2 [Entrophospora sp. SA101]
METSENLSFEKQRAALIKTFLQAHYRKFLASNRTDAYDLHQSLDMPLEQFKISDVIELCAKAWNEVTSGTIRNCWLKTGILPTLDDGMK